MRIKKCYGAYVIIFEILSDTSEILLESELEQICFSFEDSTLLDKRLPYNDLIKLQQKFNKHILIAENIKPFDELRILLKFLTNFLVITKQFNNFFIESITFRGEDEIIAYGTEIFQGDISSISFSPTARMGWTNPQLLDKIINHR